jgi:hypothetical protein
MRDIVSEVCGCGEVIEADDDSFEVKGEVMCFECWCECMDESLFGEPFGEW